MDTAWCNMFWTLKTRMCLWLSSCASSSREYCSRSTYTKIGTIQRRLVKKKTETHDYFLHSRLNKCRIINLSLMLLSLFYKMNLVLKQLIMMFQMMLLLWWMPVYKQLCINVFERLFFIYLFFFSLYINNFICIYHIVNVSF